MRRKWRARRSCGGFLSLAGRAGADRCVPLQSSVVARAVEDAGVRHPGVKHRPWPLRLSRMRIFPFPQA